MITVKEMYEQASKASACEEALEWLKTLPKNDNPLDYDHPKKAEWASWYAVYVIRGLWKEAESYIMKDPGYAYWYARYTIQGRWKEAEPYIKKDSYWSNRYKNFLKEIS